MDCSPPGASVHGISQARILKWIVISFSRGSFTLVCVSHSVMSDYFETPWAVILQAPLSMGFSRQEYWHGLPFPSPGDLPNPGIELPSPADSLLSEAPGELSFKDKIPHLKSLGFQEGKGIYIYFFSFRISRQFSWFICRGCLRCMAGASVFGRAKG